MSRWLTLFLFVLCLAGCKQRQSSGPPGAPGKPPGGPAAAAPGVAPGQPAAPATMPVPDNKAAPPSHAVKDGPTLDRLLAGATSLVVAGEPIKAKGPVATVTDAKVIQEVLAAVNLRQVAKGGFQPCNLAYGFEVRDAAGKELVFIAICGPVERGKAGRGSVGSKAHKAEWGITFPDGGALAALLDKHLPRARRSNP